MDINSINWLPTPEPKPGEEEHLNCFQKTILPFHEFLGMTEEEAKHIGTYFGGGMRAQGTCGPVNAALILLGYLYGNNKEKQDAGKDFITEYVKANSSFLCADIRDEEHVRCEAAIEFAKEYIRKLIAQEV